MRLLALLCLFALAAGAGLAQARPSGDEPAPRTVLIAGDGSLPVFDNAVAALQARLSAGSGAARTGIQRLSASAQLVAHHRALPATLDHVLAAIRAMKPAAGQGCLVFATSHGVEDGGLYLSMRDEILTPAALDRALGQGCGDAPTAVVISSCFSGSFARPPMTRDNRIVLTAARPDRTSFGCQAGRVFTVYDQCLLASLPAGGTWKRAYLSIAGCVRDEERREHATPSEPQAWFGAGVAEAALPVH